MSKLDTYLYSVLNRQQDEHAKSEEDKRGTLRGGSAGVMDPDGNAAGTCHRRAHLRSIGIEIEDLPQDKLVMFSGGRANEVVLEELLEDYLPEDKSKGQRKILKEEEIPTSWETKNGTKVTGRPDIVLGYVTQGVFRPELGIEAKKSSSLWTARSVLFEGKPKTNHLIQAMHYSWQLGRQHGMDSLPFSLVYVGYDNYAVPDWAGKFFPKIGEPLSQYVSYNDNENSKNYGKPKAVLPFIKSYELTIEEGILHVDGEPTVLDTGSLERFYEYVSEMPKTRDLGPMPLTIDALTGEELRYSNCDYCPMQKTCKRTNDYDEFIDEATRLQSMIRR